MGYSKAGGETPFAVLKLRQMADCPQEAPPAV